MANNNKKALYNFMESNQFKLFDFVAEFSEFRQFDNLSRLAVKIIGDNLIMLEKTW